MDAQAALDDLEIEQGFDEGDDDEVKPRCTWLTVK